MIDRHYDFEPARQERDLSGLILPLAVLAWVVVLVAVWELFLKP